MCLTYARVVACSDPAQRSLFALSEIAQRPLKTTMSAETTIPHSELIPGPVFEYSVPTVPTQGPLSACLAPFGPLTGRLTSCAELAHRTESTQNPHWAHTEHALGPPGHRFMPARGLAWCLTNARVVACSDPAQRLLFAHSEIAQGPLKNTIVYHHLKANLEYSPGPLYAHSASTGPTQRPLSAWSRAAHWPARNMHSARSENRPYTEPALGIHRTRIGPHRSLLYACPGARLVLDKYPGSGLLKTCTAFAFCTL